MCPRPVKPNGLLPTSTSHKTITIDHVALLGLLPALIIPAVEHQRCYRHPTAGHRRSRFNFAVVCATHIYCAADSPHVIGIIINCMFEGRLYGNTVSESLNNEFVNINSNKKGTGTYQTQMHVHTALTKKRFFSIPFCYNKQHGASTLSHSI